MHLCTNLTLVRWEDSWLEPGTGRCIELHYAYSTLWKATLQGDNINQAAGILKTGQTVTKLTKLISSYLSFFSISFFRFRYQRLRHGVIQLQALFRMWRQRTIYLAVSAFLSNCCRKNCPTCYCGTRPQHTMWAHTHIESRSMTLFPIYFCSSDAGSWANCRWRGYRKTWRGRGGRGRETADTWIHHTCQQATQGACGIDKKKETAATRSKCGSLFAAQIFSPPLHCCQFAISSCSCWSGTDSTSTLKWDELLQDNHI